MHACIILYLGNGLIQAKQLSEHVQFLAGLFKSPLLLPGILVPFQIQNGSKTVDTNDSASCER